MKKVIVIEKILSDAYNSAFNRLEQMRYLEAEKLFDYVMKYSYTPDIDMIQYAYVIIYSNTHRVEKAIKICDEMLAKGMQNKDLERIVSDICSQLKASNKVYTIDKEGSYVITNEEVMTFLDKIKPAKSKMDIFLDVFALNESEEDFYIKYFEEISDLEIDNKLEFIIQNISMELKHMVAKYIEKYHKFDKVLKSDLVNKEDSVKMNMMFILNMKEDLLFYYYLYKNGLLKKLINKSEIPITIKNFLIYQMYNFYILKLINNNKVDLYLSKDNKVDMDLKRLTQYFNDEVLDPINEFMEVLYLDERFDVDYIEDIEVKLEVMYSSSFPNFFPNKDRKEEYFVALLYFASIYEYTNQFNDIIREVYNISLEDIKKEFEIIKMILLFLNNKEEKNENRN